MKFYHATALVAAVVGIPSGNAFTSITPPTKQAPKSQLMKMIPFFLSTEEDIEVENLREQARMLEEEAMSLEKQAIALEEEVAAAAKEASLDISAKTTEAASALEEASEAKIALVAALETTADLDDTITQQQQQKQQTTLLTDGITAEEAERIRDARVSGGEKEEMVQTTPQLVAIEDGVSTAEDAEAVRLERLRAADEVAKENDKTSFKQAATMKSVALDGIENRSLRRMSLRERLNQIETKTEEVHTAPRMNQQQTGTRNKASAPSLSSFLNNPPSIKEQQNPKQESKSTDTSKPTDNTPKYAPPASLVKEDAPVTKAVQREQENNGEVPKKSMSLRELAMLSSRR